MTRGGSRALPAALFVALVVLAYAGPLLRRENFVGQDLPAYNLPMEKAVHDALARGALPAWSEEISGGRPLFPNPNAGCLHPIRAVLAFVPFPTAMRLFPILHWCLAGVGMILLTTRIGCSPSAAWVSAATYAFSGVIVSEVYYTNFLPGAALLPWALCAAVQPAGSTRRKAVAMGIAFGLLFLAGDPVSSGIAMAAALFWILLEAPAGNRRPDVAALGLAIVLGLLLAAPQIVATAAVAPETRRAVTGIRLGEALGFSVSPWRLLEFAVPYPFGATWALDDGVNWGHGVFRCFFASFFCGALPLLALLSRTEEGGRGSGLRFCRVLCIASAGLAMAGRLIPGSWSQWPSPIPLRYPEKLMLGSALAMAMAAGIAFDRLRVRPRSRALVRVVAALTILAALASAFPSSAGSAAASALGAGIAAAPAAAGALPGALAQAGLLFAATLAAIELARRPGRLPVAGAAAILAAVPLAATRCIAQAASEGAVFPPTVFARTLARRDPAGLFRTIDESLYRPATPGLEASLRADPYHLDLQRQSWYLHTPALWGRGLVLNADLDRGDLSRVETLRRLSSAAASSEDGAAFFATLGLKYGIRFRDQEPLPGFSPFGRDAFRFHDVNPAALPAIRLLEHWREEPSGVAALSDVPRLAAGEVVLETGRSLTGEARPGELRIVEREPDRMVLDVAAPDPTWLFAVRGYWSFRSIRIDGREAEAVPAQIGFSAVPIPAGSHRVEWKEQIPGLRFSAAGPALFALVSALLLIRRAPSSTA